MKLEFSQIMAEASTYLAGAWYCVHPAFKWLLSISMWVLFPTGAFLVYAKIVCALVVLDLVTKYYAVSKNNGGLFNAIRTGKLTSNSMWVGTRKKIVSYLFIMILVGLGFRFEMLEATVELIGTIAYAVMFLREGQSVAENLVEAGYKDLRWFALLLRNKEKEIMKAQEIKEVQKAITKEGDLK